MPASIVPEVSADEPIRRFTTFSRTEWAKLGARVPLALASAELERMRGLNENVSLDEVRDVYLPIARLLNIHFVAAQERFRAADRFLGQPVAKVPFIVGIAGSVAVGKSTMTRILQSVLQHFSDHKRVALVPTDGFLYSNRILEQRGLINRKGFPESYDRRALIQTLVHFKSGQSVVRVPKYSHVAYDVVEGSYDIVEKPDIVLVEGLNVLQTTSGRVRPPTSFVSDFFDFSIYVDAENEALARWYRERFALLREAAFKDPASYFARFANLSDEEAAAHANEIWNSINGPNLLENIRPTRHRADLIMRKGEDHLVEAIWLKKL
jgi:type I pantothenate kinase